MLTWIAGYVGRWAGVVPNAVRDLVHWGLHALAGVVYTVFGRVGGAWLQLLAALKAVHAAADDFMASVYGHLRQLVLVDLPKLAADALAYYRAGLAFARQLYDSALRAVQLARDYAAALTDSALAWTRQHVLAPLSDLITQLRADLLKWGYTAWYYVTHPDKLAPILLDALVDAAEGSFWRLAGPVGQFALRVVVANAGRFAQLAESIITAVL